MEIVTSLSRKELETIIFSTVHRCVSNLIKPPAPQVQLPDIVGIEEACEITGYSRPTIYKLSHLNKIPCSHRGKRLVFSRRELHKWLDLQTIPKPTAEEFAVAQLANVVRKKERSS